MEGPSRPTTPVAQIPIAPDNTVLAVSTAQAVPNEQEDSMTDPSQLTTPTEDTSTSEKSRKPRGHPHKHGSTTRDDRVRIDLLKRLGKSDRDIAAFLGLSRNQVQYARKHPLSPQHKRSGRKPTVEQADLEFVMNWLCSSEENWRTPWPQVPAACGLPHLGYDAIRSALKKQGFKKKRPPWYREVAGKEMAKRT
ncbi:putative transposable element tc1 [Phaeomoniella chlamydospora]|uniref:Putative transposable element tc1 n=1 Tax=Phaeomoniella chlamydospora TaxID=158046 RepID=A0A0G2EZJ8_PHACM|nr:putative transposable element tc1 [Phaeomoniella chlamydospora]